MVFVTLCFPVLWGDLVHAVEAVVFPDVERRALNGHNERWIFFSFALLLILYVTSLRHCTIVYGTFHGDNSLGLSPVGEKELCNQTLSPSLYPNYTKLCVPVEQFENGGLLLRELVACQQVFHEQTVVSQSCWVVLAKGTECHWGG